MKLIHLIEYSLEKEIKMRGHKLLPAIKNDTYFYEQVKDKDPEDQMQELYRRLEDMDPTPNFKFVPWMAKQYSDQKFRIEDSSRISSVLSEFKKLQPHLKKYGHSADLNQYDFHSLEEMIDSIQTGDDSSEHQSKRLEGVDLDEVNVLYDGPYGLLVIPETEEASCELGRGTKWCTAAINDNMFDYYTDFGDLYIWIDKDGSKYQFHFKTMQFMDDKDRPISKDKLDYFRTEHPILSMFFKEKEHDIIANSDFKSIKDYAINVIGGRWPEAEETIKTDPGRAYLYAKEVIKGRWPEAEDVIKHSDGIWSSLYARYVIKGRWYDIEDYVLSDPLLAYHYAKEVIQDRWPEAESIIKTTPYTAYAYARDVIKGRWPEAEKMIMSDHHMAYAYAKDVIKGRWPEAEKMIMSDPELANEYANLFQFQ